jgi:hypothetical protein
MFAMRLPPSIRIRPGLELGVAEFLSQYIGILNQFKQIATNVPDRLNGTPSAIGGDPDALWPLNQTGKCRSKKNQKLTLDNFWQARVTFRDT